MVTPVNWFMIPVKDLERAKKFYEAVIDDEMTRSEMGQLKMAWFPMASSSPGAAGALVKGEGYVPSHAGTLVYLHVKDIDTAISRIKMHGGRPLIPKTKMGELGFIAHFEDTEGNRVALHSYS